MLYIIWQCYVLHNNNVEKNMKYMEKLIFILFLLAVVLKKLKQLIKKSYLIKKVWTIYKAMLSYYFNCRKNAGKTKDSKNWLWKNNLQFLIVVNPDL